VLRQQALARGEVERAAEHGSRPGAPRQLMQDAQDRVDRRGHVRLGASERREAQSGEPELELSYVAAPQGQVGEEGFGALSVGRVDLVEGTGRLRKRALDVVTNGGELIEQLRGLTKGARGGIVGHSDQSRCSRANATNRCSVGCAHYSGRRGSVERCGRSTKGPREASARSRRLAHRSRSRRWQATWPDDANPPRRRGAH
jgi:hypothetical protein